MNARTTKDGVVISVYVKPRSRNDRIFFEGADLIIETEEPPENNRANLSVMKIIAKAVGVPTSSVSVILGQRDRVKHILIKGVDITLLDKLK